MAILSGGPNSGFSGKAGSVVGYYRMGKWVIRGSDCREVLKYQAEMPKEEWHAWISFISDDRARISNSEYLGIVQGNSEEGA
ncbi:hypothetical protein [Daejeonella sp.]|uniref:hypothetical protein n=1 Tax=Daejeonella sp. TaxID=2805397 RepID=UPI002715BF91|nr:hypothetical protein [Daejeonella sp.]MDO8993763.1 hypothetical protein [Daejeonella sp.]MDP2414159.1 hypothetical protein [Daejeonella sp.]